MPIRKLRWAATIWPGWSHLWMRGSWLALTLACLFAVLVNLLLMSTFLWTEWFPHQVLIGGWLFVAISWFVSAWLGERLIAQSARGVLQNPIQAEDLFRQAQSQYLQGDWFDAETSLSKLVEANRTDVEARLMLATLWCHTGRSHEALREVEQLSRIEAAEHWSEELKNLHSRLESQGESQSVEAA